MKLGSHPPIALFLSLVVAKGESHLQGEASFFPTIGRRRHARSVREAASTMRSSRAPAVAARGESCACLQGCGPKRAFDRAPSSDRPAGECKSAGGRCLNRAGCLCSGRRTRRSRWRRYPRAPLPPAGRGTQGEFRRLRKRALEDLRRGRRAASVCDRMPGSDPCRAALHRAMNGVFRMLDGERSCRRAPRSFLRQEGSLTTLRPTARCLFGDAGDEAVAKAFGSFPPFCESPAPRGRSSKPSRPGPLAPAPRLRPSAPASRMLDKKKKPA